MAICPEAKEPEKEVLVGAAEIDGEPLDEVELMALSDQRGVLGMSLLG